MKGVIVILYELIFSWFLAYKKKSMDYLMIIFITVGSYFSWMLTLH